MRPCIVADHVEDVFAPRDDPAIDTGKVGHLAPEIGLHPDVSKRIDYAGASADKHRRRIVSLDRVVGAGTVRPRQVLARGEDEAAAFERIVRNLIDMPNERYQRAEAQRLVKQELALARSPTRRTWLRARPC